MLLDNPVAAIKTCHRLNPTTLLPTEMGTLEYDHIETMDTIYSSHPIYFWSRKWASPKCQKGMVHRWEFYERGKKANRICSNLPDPSHRSKKHTSRDFSPKGRGDSPHLSLRARDKGDLKCLHWLLVCVRHPTTTRGYLRKRYDYRGE